MIGKKINQLATELAPASTDLTIIGNPTTGVSKKITLAQLGAIFSGAVSFYTNYAAFPTPGTTDVIYCAKDTQKLYLWSGSAYVEVFPSQALLDTYQLRSEKGNANGYASLDSSGKVPVSQLPSSIMEYKGTWSAATNTPTLANGTGDTGDVYICNAAGSVDFGAGPITFAVGDYVIYSGSIWQRSSGAVGTVTSVAASITGNAIGITGSPVTTSGTLAFAFAGTGAQYIKGDGTLATFPSTISQAEKLITEVYNSTGATLTKGTVVYINGGQGNLPTVTKALATGDSTSAQTFGIVQADITNNNNGYVVVAGKLNDLDTQAYTEGTQLYLSSTTAGAWTSTKQYAPAHLVYVGIVVRSHPTQGIVEVKIQNGYELDEIHNVAAQTPTNNDGLFWEASTSLWKNKSIATVLGYTPQAQLNGTGFVKASGTTITYDNSTYLTTSAAATTYLPMVLSSTAKSIELNGQTFDVSSVAGSYTSGRLIVTPTFTAIGYQSSGVFKGLQIATDGTANFFNTGLTRFYNQVQFDGTLTNGTYTYTLPGATGTLALTSDIPSLSGYVPYTGATTNLNLGSNNLTAAAITGSSARITTLAGSVYADVNGNLGTTAGTQNTIAYWGSQYSLASLSTTTYPDLTELSYVKGVTSSIQTQLNSKQSTLTNPVTGTGTTNYLPKFTGTSTIGNSQIFDNGSNIGLGTNNPSASYRVTISGSTYQVGTNSKIYIDNGGVGGASAILGVVGTSYGYLNTDGGYPFVFQTNNTERMRLDASGNLGLGVTPSAWSNSGNLDLQDVYLSLSSQGAYGGTISNNAYYNAGWKYKGANYATQYQTLAGEHRWLTAGVGAAAGNAISFTQAMTLNASGNLSIGNTNDTYKLDVSGTGRFTGALTSGNIIGTGNGAIYSNSSIGTNTGYFNIQSTGGYFQIGLDSSTGAGFGSAYSGNIYMSGAYPLRFWTNGAVRQTIDSTGAATFSSSVTSNGFFYTPSNATTGALSGFVNQYAANASSRSWKITNDVSSYGDWALQQSTTQTGTTYANQLYFSPTGAATFSSGIATNGYTASTSYAALFAGSVGIGTATPSTYLQVAGGEVLIGGTSTPGTLQLGNYTANQNAKFIFSASGNNSLEIYTNYSSASNRISFLPGGTSTMHLLGSGNVGIGTTSPTSPIHVQRSDDGVIGTFRGTSNAQLLLSISSGNLVYDASNGNATHVFQTNSTERARITSGGNVGIGITNPGAKLVVSNSGGTGYEIDPQSTSGTVVSLFSYDRANALWRTTRYSGLDHRFEVNGTSEAMRITSGGNVGIGTTSPSSILSIATGAGVNAYIEVAGNGNTLGVTSALFGQNGSSIAYCWNRANAELLFGTNNTERMRITSGGNILFNTTSTSGAGGISFIKDGGGIYEEIYRNTTSTASHILFTNPNGTVGTIQTSGTSTSYNTSSDYRLKTDFKDFSGLDLVSKIKAYDYEWKSDKSRSYGVIAHELQSVINYAVTGVKDGEQMQGVDYSKIVPVLIKAIQELNDKIK